MNCNWNTVVYNPVTNQFGYIIPLPFLSSEYTGGCSSARLSHGGMSWVSPIYTGLSCSSPSK